MHIVRTNYKNGFDDHSMSVDVVCVFSGLAPSWNEMPLEEIVCSKLKKHTYLVQGKR